MRILLAALVMLCCATASYAIVAPMEPLAPAQYTCTPDKFKAEIDADGNLRLTGELQAPTPGYTAEITDQKTVTEPLGDTVDAKIKLTAPAGTAIQVIDTLDIDYTFPPAQKLVVRVDKAFNWGEETIICAVAEEKKP